VRIPDFFEKSLHRLDMKEWGLKMKKQYEVDITDRVTYATVLAVERKEGKEVGIKEGIKVGIKEGEAKKSREIVLEMLMEHLSDEMILKLSKISPEELAQLKESLKHN
jgi:hypothetical protein